MLAVASNISADYYRQNTQLAQFSGTAARPYHFLTLAKGMIHWIYIIVPQGDAHG